MDPFAYLTEIKLLTTAVLGYLCFKRVSKAWKQEELSENSESLDDRIVEDPSIVENPNSQ